MIDQQELFDAFPKGIIFPYYSTVGSVPKGWFVCDGANGTPDLRNRFLRGVGNVADVGKTGGADTHSHSVIKDRNRRDGSGFEGEGDECMIPYTDTQTNVPAFTSVLFIMKC